MYVFLIFVKKIVYSPENNKETEIWGKPEPIGNTTEKAYYRLYYIFIFCKQIPLKEPSAYIRIRVYFLPSWSEYSNARKWEPLPRRRLYFKTKNKVKGLLMTYRSRSKTSCLICFPRSSPWISLDIFEGCLYLHISKHHQGSHFCSLLLTFNQCPPPNTHSWLLWQQGDRSRCYSAHITFLSTGSIKSLQRLAENRVNIADLKLHPCPASAKNLAQQQKVRCTGRLWSTLKSS